MTQPDIPIPPEAIEAVAGEILAGIASCKDEDEIAEAACRAMLKAWPGMLIEMLIEWHSRGPGIILPLPQKETDNEKI